MLEEEVAQYQPFFGKWMLGRKIGSGTFGDVYSIYHDEANVRLHAALKVLTVPSDQREAAELRSSGMSEEDIFSYYRKQVAAFINEITIMRQFRGHMNIVCYEDHMVIEHEGKLRWDILIRMERLEPLDHYFRRIHATLRDVVQMWYDISLALQSCHERGIVHRDIKPDNILVSADGCYKLVDFGISSNILEKPGTMTRAGTYSYMAPEVQSGQPYDGRADIYSLAMVIYQVLNANRYPFLPPYPKSFSAEDRQQAIDRRFAGESIPPIPDMPLPLMRLLLRSLSFSTHGRIPSAQRLQAGIRNLDLSPEELAIPLYTPKDEYVPVGKRGIPRKRGWLFWRR